MTDRKVELTILVDKAKAEVADGLTNRSETENIVKHLLDRGVILPPCKVGDTVYFANESYHDTAEIDGIQIDENGISFTWVQYDVGVDITELWDDGDFDLEDIGKTVFLTREEAERALKELKDNG